MAYTNHHRLRGNSKDRRARKLWLLATFGDGESCQCVHCGCALTYDTVEADRIIPGSHGGTYRRENLQPSCGWDNRSRNNRLNWQPVLAGVR